MRGLDGRRGSDPAARAAGGGGGPTRVPARGSVAALVLVGAPVLALAAGDPCTAAEREARPPVQSVEDTDGDAGVAAGAGSDADAGARADERERLFASADDEWVVTASRIPAPTWARSFQASVLSGERLEAGPSPSVADALRFVPGLHLVREGGPGGRASLALRGLDPNHVVVLLDGVRLNDPTNSRGGSFDPSTLALVDIERIETVRGPLSSIHGADALGGVVQIVTRGVEPDEPLRTRVRSRIGRYHTAEVAGRASAGLGEVAGLALGAALSGARDPHGDGGFDAGSLHAKLRVPLPGALELESFARLHQSSARAFPESSGGPELAVLRAVEDRDVREISFGAALGRAFAEDAAHVRLQTSRASRREDLESPGIVPLTGSLFVPPARSGDEYERWDASLVVDGVLPAPGWSGLESGPHGVVGAAAVWEDGESDTALDFGGGFVPVPFFVRRRTGSVFGELEQALGSSVVVSGSLRFDATTDARDRVSPAAGIVVALPGTPLSLFARFGRGFRLPSFYALANPLVGNPSLAIERGRGWEAGLRYRSVRGDLALQLGYFDLSVENLHDFDAAAFEIVARGRLLSRGVELEAEWSLAPGLSLIGAASFNPTDFGGTSRPPLGRPRWRGFLELHARPFPAWDVQLRALAVGSSKASAAAIDGRVVTLAGYERIDLRITHTPWPGLDVFFEIENLSDRTAREAVGFESPGIAPRIGLALYR